MADGYVPACEEESRLDGLSARTQHLAILKKEVKKYCGGMHVALVFPRYYKFYTGLSWSPFDESFDFYRAHFCNLVNRSGGIFDRGFGGDRMSILKSQT